MSTDYALRLLTRAMAVEELTGEPIPTEFGAFAIWLEVMERLNVGGKQMGPASRAADRQAAMLEFYLREAYVELPYTAHLVLELEGSRLEVPLPIPGNSDQAASLENRLWAALHLGDVDRVLALFREINQQRDDD